MNNFIVIIIILFLLYNLLSNNRLYKEDLTLIKAKDNHNFYEQYFNHKESEKHWHNAHKFMEPSLKKWSYTTFDRSYKIQAKNVYFPEDLQDIKNIINKYKNDNVVIRASGGHHTFNDISLSKDVIVKTYKLNKILKLDKIKKQVTVQSGILLEDINLFLENNNFAIPVLPAIPYQSIAGALATGSHGSTQSHGSMSSMIKDITIVLADGKDYMFTEEHGDLFRAMVTNLGALGIVYSVTLQCVDLFVVDHIRKMMTIEDFTDNANKLIKNNEYFQGYLFPFKKGKDQARVYLRKVINKFDKKTIIKNRKEGDIKKMKRKVDFGHRVLTKNFEASSYTESEIAVPKDVWKDALRDIINLFEIHKDKYRTTYPILVRFTKMDNSLIGMSSKIKRYNNTINKHVVFFNIFDKATNRCKPEFANFFKDYNTLLVKKYGGRPHYGKHHCLNRKDMIEIYGQNFYKFEYMKDLLDPKGLFTNEYIERLFVDKKKYCTFIKC